MSIVLRANKTKMVQLLRAKGYHPTVRSARFRKNIPPGPRVFTLVWTENGMEYTAYLMAPFGHPSVTIHTATSRSWKVVTQDELQRFGLIRKEGEAG